MYYIETLACHILLAVASILFIYNSVILFLKGKHNRPRQMLGFTMLTWGVMYLIFLVGCICNKVSYPIFDGRSLISSHLFICLMFLFPFEVLMPGWLNKKRGLIMLIPITLLTIIYYIGLQITEQQIDNYYSFTDLFEAIEHFNVWYRCIIFFFNLVFIYFLLTLLRHEEGKYQKWQQDNFSDLDDVDISWINYYKKMMIVICLCYIVVAIWGSRFSIIVHTLTTIIGFSILFYKALFFENKYKEDFSGSTSLRGNSSPILSSTNSPKEVIVKQEKDSSITENSINDNSFETKIPAYVETFKRWMEDEKPYLYKDFKLADVTRILPLNRSYLSRVINEGFKQNFSELVRQYRVEEAKVLLVENTSYPIHQVAEMCGFASDSTFNKAFQAVAKCTPRQFREGNKVIK